MRLISVAAWAVGGFVLVHSAQAQNLTVNEDFTGAGASTNWTALGGACLTAGDANGSIPACSAKDYKGVTQLGGVSGTLPDPANSGALRFTNASGNQTGAILWNNVFPAGSGINITFSTITYGGNGADGISFFLTDGSRDVTQTGGLGGSLGYSCSNGNAVFDGLVGAYLGLGIDEFGNFLNASDNTSTGSNGQVANRIGLRGAGDVSWASLSANYSSYYPASKVTSASVREAAVKKTCSTGKLWDYSNGTSAQKNSVGTVTYNYNLIDGSQVTLDATKTPLSFPSAKIRSNAKQITYQLKITRDNYLSLSYSYNGGTYQQVMKDQSIATTNGPLPSTLKFGFSGSTGGSNNIHEVMCFKATPATKSASAAGMNLQQGTEVKTGSQVYLAGYKQDNWSGQFTSQGLSLDTATNSVAINPVANWDASCVLTGGACTTMGSTAANPVNVAVQASSARTMLTWGLNGTTPGGIPFQFDSLSTSQKSVINAGDATSTNSRMNYLRGDRTSEGSALTSFRTRDSVLADIIDSGPAWVGPPASGYSDAWSDKTNSIAIPENASAAQKYSAFVTAAKTRLNVVYTGANDGFVHGFRTGAYDAAGKFINTTAYPNDGKEVLAYMPAETFAAIHSTTAGIDYANKLYSHAYHVNAIPYAGDLFYGNAWHTWLVGGLGAGGNGIYALDVTNPSQFSEANAASIVKADYTDSSISCSNVTSCGNYLGNTYGQPQIRRFHNGMWGYVFGNGFDSTNGKAGIYVVTVDPSTAAQTVYFLNTNSGSTSAKNGISYVTPADLDGDHVVDYVYAGDIKGNIWRFDLTSNLPSAWTTSVYGGSATAPGPLFTTTGNLPITTRLAVAIAPANTGNARVIVSFGTGYKSAQTATAAATFSTGSHRLYGIWDWDMGTSSSGWNSKTSSATLRASLTGTNSISESNLTAQTITAFTTTQRAVSSNTVCWKGSSDCSATAGNAKYGWYILLPTTSEQVIYSPILYNGALLVSTSIPAAANVLNCNDDTTDSGWLINISPASGGAFKQSSFTTDTNGNFGTVTIGTSSYVLSGIATKGVGSPSIVTAGGRTNYLMQTASGTGTTGGYNPASGAVGSRVTWQQVR